MLCFADGFQKWVAFGIVATYNNVRQPVPLFAMDVHAKLGWQTLSYLVFAIVCVSQFSPTSTRSEIANPKSLSRRTF